MNIRHLVLGALAATFMVGCSEKTAPENTDSTYTYESVENDPFGLRIYTLDNGLKVYISENHTEPRIQTNIAVRTGSKQDPADATGLAHYLEHMLFKGTSNIGSLNWAEEKKYLKMISDKYEEHRNTDDLEERKRIYKEIDSLSQIAASFVATNEYDKLISGLGAQGTNAYTSNERTVYINDIPSTELEKWLKIESERFSELVLRLFHTELEAVYEEFNRGQDSDRRQGYYKTLELLFPTHPYGQQTTIGTGEHLKTPSMEKIHDYFNRRYVPNNMAIILAGDLDPDKTIAMIDQYFGGMEKKPLEDMKMPIEEPLAGPIIEDVMGSEAEFEMIGFRLDGAGSKDDLYAELLDGILSNGTAGLIDLNLNQSQKVLKAYSSPTSNEDYGYFMMTGYARQGQELEEVRDLLLAQLDSVKQGKFEDWMIDAVIRKAKKDIMSQMEYNWIRAYIMSDAFVIGTDWNDVVDRYDRMAKITKEELMAWTSETFKDNYVAVNKRIGEKDLHKVDKPAITPVPINRDTSSAFLADIEAMESLRLDPIFVDYEQAIGKAKIQDKVELNYVKNEENELFRLTYVFDMGKNHDKLLPLAVEYLPYLGTSTMSPAEVQKELFKLGVNFDVNTGNDQSYVVLTGLEETFEEGVVFFESLLADVQANPASYAELVRGMMKKRADAKLNKRTILFAGMKNYAQYGASNPFNNVLSEEELMNVDANELAGMLQSLTSYDHRVLFYGPQKIDDVQKVLNDHHNLPEALNPIPEAANYAEIETAENKVFFCEYDMVQSELMMMHRGPEFSVDLLPEAKIFSQYFGSGLSSIVFQEIRESKALAYSAYAGFTSPSKAEDHHYIRGYIGSQANKLEDATNALLDLMSTLPRADKQFNQAKTSALKQIETNRTTGNSILWSYEGAKKRGVDYDLNSKLYPAISDIDFDKIQGFFDSNIKDKPYTYLVIGKKSEMDMSALEKLGPVQELTLEEIFGY